MLVKRLRLFGYSLLAVTCVIELIIGSVVLGYSIDVYRGNYVASK